MKTSTRKNALYNIAYRVFSVLLPLVTAPYLSRVIGRDGVGLYAYAWSINEVFCMFAMLGLANYGVRIIAAARDNREQLDRTFSEVLRMQLLVSGIMLVSYLIYVFFIAADEKPIALCLTIMSLSCMCNLEWCLMGLDLFKPIAVKNTCVKLLAAASVFMFVKQKGDIWIYGLVWSVATLAANLSCMATLRGKIRFVTVPFCDVVKHLKPCLILFVSVLAVSVYRTMDKVMLGAISGMEENGLYENAEKIIYCLSGFISAIGTVMLPKATVMIRKGENERLLKHIDLTMRVVLCMVTAMAFGVAAVADDFIPLFYGHAFTGSIRLIIPLSFTLVIIGFANVIRTQWILPNGMDKLVVKSVCTGAVINLIVNISLIPAYGAMGAVIGTLLAEFTVPLVQWLHLRRQLPYHHLLMHTVVSLCQGIVMLLVVRMIAAPLKLQGWPRLALLVAVGMGAYGITCLCVWKMTGQYDILRLLKAKKHGERN